MAKRRRIIPEDSKEIIPQSNQIMDTREFGDSLSVNIQVEGLLNVDNMYHDKARGMYVEEGLSH